MIPVSAGRESWFLFLFVAQYLAGLVALTFLSGTEEVEALESVRLVAPLIITATANTILLVEGVPMVAEQFLNRRRLEAEKKGEKFSEPPPEYR